MPPPLAFAARIDAVTAWAMTSGVRIIIILLAASLLLRMIRLLVARLSPTLTGLVQQSLEAQKRAQTLTTIARTTATTVVIVITIMLVLGEIGIDVAPLIAAAGIGGLAIGFGAQNLVRDMITGFFLLLEDQIRVGDIVKIGDKSGQVEQIGLRIITLRDFDGSVHIIPNGAITSVTNQTKGFAYAVVPVGVPLQTNVETVTAILKEIGDALRQDSAFMADLLDEVEVLGIDDFAAPRLKFTVRVKTLPAKQWRVARELRRRIKLTFDAKDIPLM
jgi:small-conductance mechanosensitive channel